jgi:ubiquinone/menaquinone biosynthesis C-methylase UbiE
MPKRSVYTTRCRDFFEKQADSYDKIPWVRDAQFYKRIAAFVSNCEKESVLDLATGTGSVLTNMAPYCRRIIGVDFSRRMLMAAWSKIRLIGLRNANLVLSDIDSLPFNSNSFDLLIIRNGLHHLQKPLKRLEESKRLVTKHGALVVIEVVAPNERVRAFKAQILKIKEPDRSFFYTLPQLVEFVKLADLEVIDSDLYVMKNKSIIDWLSGSHTSNRKVQGIIALVKTADEEIRKECNILTENGDIRWDSHWGMVMARLPNRSRV